MLSWLRAANSTACHGYALGMMTYGVVHHLDTNTILYYICITYFIRKGNFAVQRNIVNDALVALVQSFRVFRLVFGWFFFCQ